MSFCVLVKLFIKKLCIPSFEPNFTLKATRKVLLSPQKFQPKNVCTLEPPSDTQTLHKDINLDSLNLSMINCFIKESSIPLSQ